MNLLQPTFNASYELRKEKIHMQLHEHFGPHVVSSQPMWVVMMMRWDIPDADYIEPMVSAYANEVLSK